MSTSDAVIEPGLERAAAPRVEAPPGGHLHVGPSKPPVSDITGSSLTVAVPIDPARLEKLTRFLVDEIGEALTSENHLRLRDLRLVHFLRWVIVPADAESGAPPLLVFGSDFDGTRADHLRELWNVGSAGLDEIYAHCVGAPRFGSAEDLITYFEAHRIETMAFYSGTRGRSAEQIRGEDRLQVTLANDLDDEANQSDVARSPYSAAKRLVRGRGALVDLPRTASDSTTLLSKLLHGPLFWPIAGAAAAALALPAAAFGLLVRAQELSEPNDERQNDEADGDQLASLKRREDRSTLVQNQLTHVVTIKPGAFRMASLKVVLSAIDLLARHFFDRGNLGGIPSIHYARWMVLEDSRRLLFFSNFDGSWEAYLGDFVDQAATGLTAVWSNTVGFPASRFLLWDGARDEERFKNWTRAHQLETQVWYSAYPSLSVQNVNDNTRLVEGLRDEPQGAGMQEWLRTL